MAEMCPKMVNIYFFTPGGQNMKFGNKSKKINKFCNVLQGHLNQYKHSKMGRWSAHQYLLNSAEFGCYEENESFSEEYPDFI